jgi:hypothetical protein
VLVAKFAGVQPVLGEQAGVRDDRVLQEVHDQHAVPLCLLSDDVVENEASDRGVAG